MNFLTIPNIYFRCMEIQSVFKNLLRYKTEAFLLL